MKLLKQTKWEETPILSEQEVSTLQVPEKLKETFCEYWPTAQPILEMAEVRVQKPLAKLIIRIAIRICEGIAARNCK